MWRIVVICKWRSTARSPKRFRRRLRSFDLSSHTYSPGICSVVHARETSFGGRRESNESEIFRRYPPPLPPLSITSESRCAPAATSHVVLSCSSISRKFVFFFRLYCMTFFYVSLLFLLVLSRYFLILRLSSDLGVLGKLPWSVVFYTVRSRKYNRIISCIRWIIGSFFFFLLLSTVIFF